MPKVALTQTLFQREREYRRMADVANTLHRHLPFVLDR